MRQLGNCATQQSGLRRSITDAMSGENRVAINKKGKSLMKRTMVALLGVVALVGAAGAAVQLTSGQMTPREIECLRQADDRGFGIHEYQRHRFFIRCVADLPDLDLYDQQD